MADGQGNINRSHHTGTVPKKKYSNNAMEIHSSKAKDQSNSPRMPNNLSPSWHMLHADSANFIHNKRRNHPNKYLAMDLALDDSEVPNGVNYSINGVTPASSSSTSRRNSVGSSLKCDNVTRYPDHKQIEDKLSQIREYLDVTSSLMTSLRNSDEQIIDIDEETNLIQLRNQLLDSEKKLVNLLEEIENNEKVETEENQDVANIDNYSENSGDYIKRAESTFNSLDDELTAMRDQQLTLLKLHQKSENKLLEARHIQDRIASLPHCSSQVNLDSEKCNKNMSLTDFDTAIRDLEERTKRLNLNKRPNEKVATDKLMSEMQHLQSQIVSMHDANNEREHLIQNIRTNENGISKIGVPDELLKRTRLKGNWDIPALALQTHHVLDNRDSELRCQQAELKKKLMELQNKKEQVDHLVLQLQIMDENNPSDVGVQVRSIVTMKDQLSKLKEMLEIVNNVREHATPADVQAAANEICLTAGNLQNEISKPSHKRNDSYVENRLDNHVSNETYQKQLNKSQRNEGARPKQRTSSINEKLALQSELEAKKRELEEIMGKHKAAASNLNHDVRGNPVNDMSWKPPIFCQDQASDDRLSSDGDENEYSEVQVSHNVIFPQPVNSYYGCNRSKRGLDNRSDCEVASERSQGFSQIPERNIAACSAGTSEFVTRQTREPPNNQNREKQDKIQKQLELIKSVCDSVLDQIPKNQQPTSTYNIPQVRNNITPSSIHSEQRASCSPAYFRANQNQVNVLHPTSDSSWGNFSDLGNYQNLLATNTLQTQSLMLNTLNQCCQMLWLQQRELVQLKNTVNMLQERLEIPPSFPQPGNIPSNLHTPTYNPLSQHQIHNNHHPGPSPLKTNQVSAACSMPNLNHYNSVSVNNDMAFSNTSNLPNSALLESCLNNSSHLNTTQVAPSVAEHANNLIHAVNSNLNQALPAQIWNGQALNNQVAPGNRANNYWDNFRSYSRQNQLSSKNSETSIHNSAPGSERFHFDRVNPFPLVSTSKSNSEHSSTNSQENTPRKRSFQVPRHNMENTKSKIDHHGPPPDVLNVNQNLPKSGIYHSESPAYVEPEPRLSSEELEFDLRRLLDIEPHRSNHSLSEGICCNGRTMNVERRSEQQRPRKKVLVEELRENVYKEVASLISANEARPHFLIQLFKDLQKIESDSLRLKILQAIQNILSQSLNYPSYSNSRQFTETESTLCDSSEQAAIWSRPTKQFSSDILNMRLEADEPFLQNSYKEIVALLESKDDDDGDIIGNHLLESIKQVFLESELFRDSVKDDVFLKHFSNVLDDVLEQYRGKKIGDIKMELIQTIGDLLQGELSFIHLIQETIPEGCIAQERKDSVKCSYNPLFDSPGPLQNDCIENGDLAEADQSRLEEGELEDEGAVGGIVESTEEESRILSQGHSEEILNVPTIDYPANGEGLDQVPTRLATKMNKSGATTPTKDVLN